MILYPLIVSTRLYTCSINLAQLFVPFTLHDFKVLTHCYTDGHSIDTLTN